jgi:hypothetical protein
MYGIFPIIECVAQITRTAADRQVADVELGLAHGNGVTLSSQAT